MAGGRVTGVDWDTMGRDQFDRLVECLLCRIHRRQVTATYHAVNGRGGDDGIDSIAVDHPDVTKIYQLKYFPEGFSGGFRTRRTQVKRSFTKAMKHKPQFWTLVVPNTVTTPEDDYVKGLKGEFSVTVDTMDRGDLDDLLSEHSDIWEYFRFRSPEEYLLEKAALVHNPVIRTGDDLERQLRNLRENLDAADPYWTFDVTIAKDMTIRTLRAKDPRSTELSPIKHKFAIADTELNKALSRGIRFGVSESLKIDGAYLVNGLKIEGPPLVAFEGAVQAIEFHPGEPGPWIELDIVMTDAADAEIDRFLVRGRGLNAGIEGFILEVEVSSRLKVLFSVPAKEGTPAGMDMTLEPVNGVKISEVLEIRRYLHGLSNACHVQVQANDKFSFELKLNERVRSSEWRADYKPVWLLAEDLHVIEQKGGVQFRYPTGAVAADERVKIRNLRLVLDGHAVALPYANILSAALQGDQTSEGNPLLESRYVWLRFDLPGDNERTVLGKTVQVPMRLAGLVQLRPGDAPEARAALNEGRGREEIPVTLHTRPNDRLRMYLAGSRFDTEEPVITPWELPGINQDGILGPAPSELASGDEPGHE
jgi:hypothetical protein